MKWNTKKCHKGRKGIERGWETEKYSLNLPDPGAGEPNRDLPGTSFTLVRKHTEVKMPSSWVGKAGAFVKIPVSVQCLPITHSRIRAWIVEAFGAEYSSLSSEAIHGDMALLVLPRPGNATFSCDGGRSQDLVVTRTDPGISLVWTNSNLRDPKRDLPVQSIIRIGTGTQWLRHPPPRCLWCLTNS